MLERAKNQFRNFKLSIGKSLTIFNESEKGIDFNYVFSEDYSEEFWHEQLVEIKNESTPRVFDTFCQIITDAADRTTEERITYVEALAAPRFGLWFSKGSSEFHSALLKYEQFQIDVNSISDTNLKNMKKAIESLKTV